MYIKSKFQDYYDCGIAYGVDPKIRYNRKHTHEIIKNNDLPDIEEESYDYSRPRWSWRISKASSAKVGDLIDVYSGYLWFCGKSYRFVELHTMTKRYFETDSRYYMKPKITTVWRAEDVPSSIMDQLWFYGRKEPAKFVIENNPIESDKINLHFKSPIVKLTYKRGVHVDVNPCLKDIGFSVVIDPYTAFQEISMYLVGVLGDWEDPDLNPEPDGKQKMINHGMDPVQGFRRN